MKKNKILILTVVFFCLSNILIGQGDTPCMATSVSVNSGICGTYIAGTTVGAAYQNNASNGGTPTCASPGAPDVWYSFVAPSSGQIIITTTSGTITDSGIQLYASSNNLCTGILTAYNCNDDSGPGNMSELNLCGLTPGNTYFLRLWNWGGSGSGTFNICFYTTSIPVVSQNCAGGTQVCNNSSFVGNSSGGGVQEINACNQGTCGLTIENNSSWYYINIGTSGTVTMTITPSNGTDDYDYMIWGPTNSCPPINAPIRCNFAAYPRVFGCGTNTNPTGLNNISINTTASACQDRPFLQQLTVLAGEIYILMIDGYTSSSSPYTLSWGGTSTLSCIPIPLPITLTDFHCETKSNNITLYWTTETETNNDYFELERSTDAINWIAIASNISGAGNSSSPISYWHQDYLPPTGTYYYRLKQVDNDGNFTYSEWITSCNYVQDAGVVIAYFNTIGQEVNINTAVPGLYIKQYSKDGNVRREVYYKTEK